MRPSPGIARLDPVAVGLGLGWLADRALGDPRRAHPVAFFGTWAGWVESHTHRDTRSAGVVTEAITLAPVLALGLTAHRLKAMGLIDKIVNEPLGGAHRDPQLMAQMLKRALADSLRQFQGMKPRDLIAARHEKLMSYGKFKEISQPEQE